jgi:hypothetical protein
MLYERRRVGALRGLLEPLGRLVVDEGVPASGVVPAGVGVGFKRELAAVEAAGRGRIERCEQLDALAARAKSVAPRDWTVAPGLETVTRSV